MFVFPARGFMTVGRSCIVYKRKFSPIKQRGIKGIGKLKTTWDERIFKMVEWEGTHIVRVYNV